MLLVRDATFKASDQLAWPTHSLTGPTGPVPLQLESRPYDTEYWAALPPATDYRGPALYAYTPTGTPPGRYTYNVTVDVRGQWSCSKYNRDVCSWLEGDKVRYEWVFDWDGQTTVTVAPSWRLGVDTSEICGSKGCAAIIAYAANVPLLTQIEIQRKSQGKPWRTIQKDKVVGYSGWIFDESAKPGVTYQYRIVTTDPSRQVSKAAKLKLSR